MIGMDFHYRPKINFRDKGFRQVLRILPARSVDQGIDYIESIAEIRFASELSVGSVTNYENAVMLYNAPVALIGTAISTAAFPRLTDRIAQGRPDLFRKEFLRVLKTMIWIAMPIAVLSFFIRDYLARLIFARNNREYLPGLQSFQTSCIWRSRPGHSPEHCGVYGSFYPGDYHDYA
jgi:putative peptidoglycan lipid II flippase